MCGHPDLVKPTQLILSRRIEVRLGNCERQAIALPGLSDARLEVERRTAYRPRRFNVDVSMSVIAPSMMGRIVLHSFIEKALARYVVVEPDDVRGTRMLGKPLELRCTQAAVPCEPVPKRMVASDAPTEQVPPQPTQLVLELGLITEQGSAEGLPHIIRLYELDLRIDVADGAHRAYDSFALVQERARENALVAAVRKPVAVPPAKARGGEGLVDRRVVFNPGITGGNCTCILRQ